MRVALAGLKDDKSEGVVGGAQVILAIVLAASVLAYFDISPPTPLYPEQIPMRSALTRKHAHEHNAITPDDVGETDAGLIWIGIQTNQHLSIWPHLV